MRVRLPYLKHKPRLYFDENFPPEISSHFCRPYWKKKLYVTSAAQKRHCGKADIFHHNYCTKLGYTLVTLDLDFNKTEYIHSVMVVWPVL
jgi:hypothetical protein